VIVPELAAIKHAHYFLDLVDDLGYPPKKVLLVQNKSDPRAGIGIRAIENSLKHQVFAQIPYDEHIVLKSVNQGIPYMVMPNIDEKTPVIQETNKLTQLLLEELMKV
jgi:Flp pilus assembly CpaE family ATPase